MANYTPQQIEQFLQEFFDVVGTRQYIGARYVPLFGRKDEESIAWDDSAPYEPLTIVLYQGNSFTSRTYVPAGVDILDTHYWANTGNYNAQVEMYRQEVLDLRDDWQDYQTDLNGQWTEYKDDTDADLAQWKQDTTGDLDAWKTDTLEDFEEAIDNTPNATYTAGKVYINDWTQYCTLATTSGYINSIAYDATNDVMYIASFVSGNTCQIKKYTDWSQRQGQTNVAYDAIIDIDNNHCNSMTLYDNKLFCSGWDTNVYTIVDLTTFTQLSVITGPIWLRAFGVGDKFTVISPFNSNQMLTVLPFREYTDAQNPLEGLWLTQTFNSQSSFAQDCDIRTACYYRLCSAGGNSYGKTKDYIEVYPILGSVSSPMVIPIQYSPIQNTEYEGLTSGNGKTFLSAGDTVIFSTEMESVFVRPQVIPSQPWASNGIINYPESLRASGLPIEDTSQVTNFPDNMTLVKIPHSTNALAKGQSLKVTITINQIEGHVGTVCAEIPYDDIPVDSWEYYPGIQLRNTYACGNLTNGLYIANLQIFRDISSLSTGQPHIGIVLARYTDITPDGVTTKNSNFGAYSIKVRMS